MKRVLLLTSGLLFALSSEAPANQLDACASSSASPCARATASPPRRKRIRRRHRRGFRQLRQAQGLSVRDKKRAWGTKPTVYTLQHLGKRYAEAFPHAGPIHVHDISGRWGGRLAGHRSHRYGIDVDIRLPVRSEPTEYTNATKDTIDLARTWFVIEELVNSCRVDMLFLDRELQRALYHYAAEHTDHTAESLEAILQFPSWKRKSIVRHWRNHRNHLHVRFRGWVNRKGARAAKAYCRDQRQALWMARRERRRQLAKKKRAVKSASATTAARQLKLANR
ncbi:MAG: penicillin-insensitive murein endopeptidase [Deltaproteobacteria bacterium]|nr:penicillin-insensitive murein endopeptidase [Deltaproteobacteria bacterium]